MNKEKCELIARGQTLAEQRGLDPVKVKCPVENCCDGSFCIFLSADNVNHGEFQVAKFYKKIENHFDKASQKKAGSPQAL